ncbi:MAG: ferrous iron transporter B, partial [Verrucomicrobia bacterium]|nr:ferrous iron transporter B [Verrucomicrobiota bacterium]
MPASTSPDPLKPQGNLEQMVVLTGNPNAGKTTVFNALTGLRARVGNYAGVTVERKEGRLRETQRNITVLDLPGAYSLSPQSLDEQIARDVLFHRLHEVQAPAVVVVVVDAANLQRNLYFATQVIELGYPTVVALNMIDVAEGNGCKVDSASLAKALGVPVVPLSASQGQGIEALRTAILQALQPKDPPTAPRFFCELPEIFGQEATAIASQLRSQTPDAKYQSLSEALLLLSDDRALESAPAPIQQTARPLVIEARKRLESSGVDWRSSAIAARYARIAAIEQMVVTLSEVPSQTFTDRLDAIVTHRFWGVGIFIALMTAMFQSIFTLAAVPADALESWINAAGAWTAGRMPAGPLSELIQLGVFAGVGAVVVFLPQICLLFLFIGLLEDTGYMARAAFL